MAKTVLDVGNCAPDHRAIKEMLTRNFGAQVIQAHSSIDALEYLRTNPIHLVLINRKLDQDYSDGMEVLKLIKQDSDVASTPVMLVTNHEEYQQQAMQFGAIQGFGKLALNSEETRARLASVLD
jgi:CheY-like chemotaxis protein